MYCNPTGPPLRIYALILTCFEINHIVISDMVKYDFKRAEEGLLLLRNALTAAAQRGNRSSRLLFRSAEKGAAV